MSPKFIVRLDASLMSQSGCRLRTYLKLFEQLNTQQVSNEIQFGTAFHYFAAEVKRNGGNFGKAFNGAKEIHARPCSITPKKEYLQEVSFLTKVCDDWYEWHEEKDSFEILFLEETCAHCQGSGTIDIDNELSPVKCGYCNSSGKVKKYLVEQTFSIKIYEDDDVIVLLVGTIDKIGKFKNGCYGIGDYKTTAVRDPISYFRPYALSCQLRTYIYAVKKHAELYPDSIWAEMAKTPLVAFIEGIFYKPPSPQHKITEIVRSDCFQFKDWDMKDYEAMLQFKVAEVVHLYYMWRNNTVPMREGIMTGTCGLYNGSCMYFNLCAAPNDNIREQLVNKNYTKKEYDPLSWAK